MAFVAVAHNASPYFTLYDGDTWLKAADFSLKPGANPAGNAGCVAFSPNAGLLAVGHFNSPYLAVYNTATWARVTLTGGNPTGTVKAISFSPDGSLLAVAHTTSPFLTVYNTSTWAKVTLTGGTPVGSGYGSGLCVAFSPNGSFLALGHSANAPWIEVYNTSDWSKVTFTSGMTFYVNSVAWTTTSSHLIATSDDKNTFTVYDVATWGYVEQPSGGYNWSLKKATATPDGGRLLFINGGSNNEPELFDLSTWTSISFNNAAPINCASFALSTDGSEAYFVNNAPPYFYTLNLSTLLFSSAPYETVATSGEAFGIAVPASTELAARYLKTTASDPVRGPDGNAIAGVTVRPHRRSDGVIFSPAATTAADGSYSLGPYMIDHGEVQLVFMDPDAEPLYNDLIVRVIPA